MNTSTLRKRLLQASVAAPAFVMLSAGFAAPAFAQAAAEACTPGDEGCEDDSSNVILVTGSLFSRTDTETPSPVTSLSAETLAERGINTIAEAVQRIPANNAGTITAGWNTGFNFASGANAPALRGMTVQSTLSIADGLRIAPYPLADDGQRNFVDLNTIPNAIIDRIEILRDGASSTYGADAIAGVINVITKKEVQGIHANVSSGLSQEGDAAEQRIDLTVGYGDLDDQGFNFYVSGEYQKQDALWARDRGYPFNTQDWTQICSPETGSCMHNLNWNGISPEDGNFNALVTIPGVTLIRPYQANGTTTAGGYQFLNPAAGCRQWDFIPGATIAAQTGSTAFPNGICEVPFQGAYIMLQPEVERMGLSGRFTFNIGSNAQAYAMVNYYNTKTHASFTPLGLNGTPTPPNNGAAAYNVFLPDYVCAAGVGTLTGQNTGCTAANGVLNPYNPYAGTGLRARAFVRSTRPRTVDTDGTTLRGVLGIDGSFGDGWVYSANFTASEVRLNRAEGNYFIPQRIADLLARGTLNLNDLEANSQATWDFIAPLNQRTSVSSLWQAQATIAKELFELPGGMLQAAVGASYREESIDAPSGNPGTTGNQYDRYYGINSVGTAGSRDVKSAFFEVNAPLLDSLEFNFSGRYDKYSTGQENFSPKGGVKFTPIDGLALRGTVSKGFRIPSFNEAFGLPTTGYVTQNGPCGNPNATPPVTTPAGNLAFCNAHPNPTPLPGQSPYNSYATGQYSLGLTSIGNPALDPERSTAFTAGAIIEPMRNVSFTVDFWHIKVKDLIGTPAGQGDAIAQYYANNGVVTVPGYTAIAGNPDPAFPGALPLIGFLQSSFTNQASQVVSGLDFGANIRYPLTDSITLRSVFDASWLMKYELTREDGTVERYDGTLSPCNITSCSGAPSWRASWQNSLDIGSTTLSLTAYYTDGYHTASVDYGATRFNCDTINVPADSGVELGSTNTYADGTPVNCTQGAQWNADFSVRHQFTDNLTMYLDVLNVFGIDANVDTSAAYHLFGFNPAWGGPNMMGRYFRLGAKLDF